MGLSEAFPIDHSSDYQSISRLATVVFHLQPLGALPRTEMIAVAELLQGLTDFLQRDVQKSSDDYRQ